MNKLFLPIVACVLAACGSDKQQALRYDVIPLPQEINLLQESPFKLTRNTVIAYPEGNALLGHNADFLADYIEQATGFRLRTKAVKMVRMQIRLLPLVLTLL